MGSAVNYKNFVSAEEVAAEQNNVRTLLRFFASLGMLRKILLPTIIAIFVAAALPPYFLWFVGQLLACTGESVCEVSHSILSWQVTLAATLPTLVILALVAILSRTLAWLPIEQTSRWVLVEEGGLYACNGTHHIRLNILEP